MVGILDILPLISGWEIIHLIDSKSIKAGEDSQIYSSTETDIGWILGAKMSSDVSDASVDIAYNPEGSAQTIDIALKPSELYANGFITPDRSGAHVETYDTVLNIYSAAWIPQVPFPFNGMLDIRAVAGSSDSNITYDIEFIRITDIDTFLNSLKLIIAPPQPKPEVKPTIQVPERYVGFLP